MNIQLPAFVIADLYKDSLVLPAEPVTKSPESPAQVTTKNEPKKEDGGQITDKKRWLGGNKKNISILVNDAGAAFIGETQLETLSKLLGACKLTVDDIAIINYHHNAYSFAQLKEELHPQYIFMFDVSAQQLQLPFTIPNYQLQKYDGCTMLIAPAITLSENKTDDAINAEKRKLWMCLKKIFNL